MNSILSTKLRKPGVTLAICTFNGRSKLEPTIKHILQQEVPREIEWELLVVDNASTDGTAEFVQQLWPDEQADQLRIIREEKLGAIHARTRAINEARYTYLSFIDDDNWISPNWISEINHIFSKYPKVGIISCPSVAHISTKLPHYFDYIKGWLAIGTRFEQEGVISERPVSFWTAGCSFCLQAFDYLENEGVKPCLTGRKGSIPLGGEDHELCLLITMCGWDVYFSKEIFFIHQISDSRLQEKNVKNLIYYSVKCYTVLDTYRDYYRRGKIPTLSNRLSTYFFRYLHRVIALKVKEIFLRENGITPNQISYLIAKGALVGFFQHINDVETAKQNIKKTAIIHATFPIKS